MDKWSRGQIFNLDKWIFNLGCPSYLFTLPEIIDKFGSLNFAIDFFVMPTARFQMLYVLVIIWHETRQVVHFNVTGHPTARWAAQQIVDAYPFDTLPKYLLRNRDSIYGDYFQSRIKNM